MIDNNTTLRTISDKSKYKGSALTVEHIHLQLVENKPSPDSLFEHSNLPYQRTTALVQIKRRNCRFYNLTGLSSRLRPAAMTRAATSRSQLEGPQIVSPVKLTRKIPASRGARYFCRFLTLLGGLVKVFNRA